MQLQMKAVEDACKELYIRALKVLPDDVKAGIERLNQGESDARAQVVLKTMITNIAVAERNGYSVVARSHPLRIAALSSMPSS